MDAENTLNAVNATLQELDRLTSAVENQIGTLRENATAYVDAAHHARKCGETAPKFNNTTDPLVRRLMQCQQQVHGIANELVRFS